MLIQSLAYHLSQGKTNCTIKVLDRRERGKVINIYLDEERIQAFYNIPTKLFDTFNLTIRSSQLKAATNLSPSIRA